MIPGYKALEKAGIEWDDKLAPAIGANLITIAQSLLLVGTGIANRDQTQLIRDFLHQLRAGVATARELSEAEREEAAETVRKVVLVSVYAASKPGADMELENVGVAASRAALSAWIQYLRPLLDLRSKSPGAALDADEIQRGLLALDSGETPGLFAPAERIARSRLPHTQREKQLEIWLMVNELKAQKWPTTQIAKHLPLTYDAVKRWGKPSQSLPPAAAEAIRRDHQSFLDTNPSQDDLRARLERLKSEFSKIKRDSGALRGSGR